MTSSGCVPSAVSRLWRREDCFLTERTTTTAMENDFSPIAATPVSTTTRLEQQQQQQQQRHQGVLWKRRDVFKNRWRPRWFVLQPDQGIIAYYLLTESVADAMTNIGSSPSGTNNNHRDRSFSVDSTVSENNLDYDVVPRGTIYLMGCTVAVNDDLTKGDDMWAFTITPPASSEGKIHLAARTRNGRTIWVDRLQRVCRRERSINTPLNLTIPEESEQDASVDDDVSDTTETVWKHSKSRDSLYAGLPESLVATIERNIQEHLPICNQGGASVGWKAYYERGDHIAYRREEDGDPMIKSVAVLEHSPKQIFRLLMNINGRHLVETNVHGNERVQVLNPHTFLDYYAYDAIWPTAAREFAVCMHWQVLSRGQERAICIVAFSCLESEASKPIQENHVRAKLMISMYLLRPVGNNQCHLTRLLSFNPGVPKHLARMVVEQQSRLPGILADYLDRTEPEIPESLLGEIDDDTLVRNVIDKLDLQGGLGSENVRTGFEGPEKLDSIGVDSSRGGKGLDPRTLPRWEIQAVILMTPVFLHRLLKMLSLPGSFPLFLVSAYLTVRFLFLLHLGPRTSPPPSISGPVTARFSVELKGIMRFITNKKEEREELGRGTADVSVVHLVAAAVSAALKHQGKIRKHRVIVPSLLIDEYVDLSRAPMSVSVLSAKDMIISVPDVDGLSIQEIADELALSASESIDEPVGECLVLAAPDFENSNIQLDADSRHPNCSVVAVVGGVHIERLPSPRGYSQSRSCPMISISLTIHNADFTAATRYAEEVRKFLQFPEMCDE